MGTEMLSGDGDRGGCAGQRPAGGPKYPGVTIPSESGRPFGQNTVTQISARSFPFAPHVDRQQLNLKFKGDRTYMHGSDIYNVVDRLVRETDVASYISRLAFRRFARRDCDLLWDKPASNANLFAQGTASLSDGNRSFWVIESDRPAAGRYPFDEDSVVAPAVRHGEQIVLEKRSIYTPIEEIIALTKRLSYELMPDIDGKWVFGQLNLRCALPDEYRKLRITRKSEVAGRFSVNDIEIDDNQVGDIRFIVGAP